MITGEAGASNRGSSGGDATTTSNIRVEQFPGIDDLSPELLLIIANYLPPSDVLKFSIASEKAAFLQPDFDEVKINSNNMARGENFHTEVLDIEVTADVDEVLVTFERETRVPVCDNHQPVVFKRNLEVIGDGNGKVSIYQMLSAKKLDTGKVSTMRGEIAAKGDRFTIEILEDFCCRISEATITVFYANRRTSSAISSKVNPLNILPCYSKRCRTIQ